MTSEQQDKLQLQEEAAMRIQRIYRGHRERRRLQGYSLTPTERWHEAIRDATYQDLVRPNWSREGSGTGSEDSGGRGKSRPKQLWGKAIGVAKQAQRDDQESGDSSSESGFEDEISKQLRRRARYEKREKRRQQRMERKAHAKAMDIQYFLEMVDLKHRYGSNLRPYHDYWKQQDIDENFFFWLDHGEGRNIDLPTCSRAQLDKECVRYLSREERMAYLVKIDSDGRLSWAKNGQRIDTTTEYTDSKHGIVPVTHPDAVTDQHQLHRASTTSSSSSNTSYTLSTSSAESINARRYANPPSKHQGPFRKHIGVTPATVFNQLLRKTVRKNTWIFVVDISFRLYVGIKQSGAFQHSSFLHGARVSAAGLIKIKDGKLKSLAPLSGHYRPSASHFRKFIHSLQDAGVDMSGTSISKSYAVLIGLEAYSNLRKGKKRTVKKGHDMVKKVKRIGSGKLEDDARRPDEEDVQGMEKRKKELNEEEKLREDNKTALGFMRKLRIRPREAMVKAG